jgi:hypothetical protein
MKDKNPCRKRQMGHSKRKCNQVWKPCQAGVRLEEFASHRKQSRTQNPFHARQIDFRIFSAGMVSVHQNGAHSQRQQDAQRLIFAGCNRALSLSHSTLPQMSEVNVLSCPLGGGFLSVPSCPSLIKRLSAFPCASIDLCVASNVHGRRSHARSSSAQNGRWRNPSLCL